MSIDAEKKAPMDSKTQIATLNRNTGDVAPTNRVFRDFGSAARYHNAHERASAKRLLLNPSKPRVRPEVGPLQQLAPCEAASAWSLDCPRDHNDLKPLEAPDQILYVTAQEQTSMSSKRPISRVNLMAIHVGLAKRITVDLCNAERYRNAPQGDPSKSVIVNAREPRIGHEVNAFWPA